MMSMRFRVVLLSLALTLALCGVVFGLITDFTVNPTTVYIQPGSQQDVIVTVTVDNASTTYRTGATVSTGTSYIDVSVSGPYNDSAATIPVSGVFTTTSVGDIEYIDWTPPSVGTYYFRVTIYAAPNTSTNGIYNVLVWGSPSQIQTIPGFNVTIKVVNILPIPETATAMLFGIGLILLIGLVVFRR